MEARHGQDRIWDQKAKQQGLEALRTVHTVEINCVHNAHKACAHRWVILGAMPWSNKLLAAHNGSW